MKIKSKNVFFISDTHFGDDRFQIMNRPFSSLDEMHNLIKTNWNKVIGKEDLVFHLGDVCYSKRQDLLPMVNELNGEKHLIIGNHDVAEKEEFLKYFKTINENLEINVKYEDKEYNIMLNHYPSLGVADKFNLVAHVHSVFKVQKNMINVGVDVNHFRPYSFKDIVFVMNAINSFYDQDAWVAYSEANTAHMSRGKPGNYYKK